MAKDTRSIFSIKCECLVFRNECSLLSKRKSKFSLLSLDEEAASLTVLPIDARKGDVSLEFSLKKLKTVHKKYIDQGKITIEFVDKKWSSSENGDTKPIDSFVQIMVSSASKENLQLLINKIVKIRKISVPVSAPTDPSKEIKRKSQKNRQSSEEHCYLTRKELKSLALNPKKNEEKMCVEKSKRVIKFFDLPVNALQTIFQFCDLPLEYRLIAKQISSYILRRIHYIRFRDEVDEQTFNKLGRWAHIVECRMKFVKNIDLQNKRGGDFLRRENSKTLKFGKWKQISPKNIKQLQSVRIFCLQIPYALKFSLKVLSELRMVQLRLKANTQVNCLNENIKEEDLLALCSSWSEMRVLQIPICTTSFLAKLQRCQQFEELHFHRLVESAKEQGSWEDFSKFVNLKALTLRQISRASQLNPLFLCFPTNKMQFLEIGSFMSIENMKMLPATLKQLRLHGQNYQEAFIKELNLPLLEVLDIRGSPNVRIQSLEHLRNMCILTNWTRDHVDQANFYYGAQGVAVRGP